MLRVSCFGATVYPRMAAANFTISPVNMEARKALDMRAGDTVRVHVKVQEKGKTRLQMFEGTVLARRGGTSPSATFTVRRVAGGYGVEKIFPLYSPLIDKIEIVRRVKTRRAKLFHIREKAAREIKRQMRKMQLVNISTKDHEDAMAAEAPADLPAQTGAPEMNETAEAPAEVTE